MRKEFLGHFDVLQPGGSVGAGGVRHEKDDRDYAGLEEEVSAQAVGLADGDHITPDRVKMRTYTIYHAPILVQMLLSMKSDIDAIVALAFCKHRILQSLSAGLSGSEDKLGDHLLAAHRRRIGRHTRILRFQSLHISRFRTSESHSGSGVVACLRYDGRL